jgi:hypothetical protein
VKINEEITKADVDKEIKNYINATEFKEKINRIVKDRIKDDPEFEDKVVEISKNVITQLFKSLWTNRNTWRNGLKNKSS